MLINFTFFSLQNVLNNNSMCLSILHFFHFTTFWMRLKNINMIVRELHKTNALSRSKKMKYHVSWTKKRTLQLTFSCYISSGCGFLYNNKQPSILQQFLKWAWNKLSMYLKLYYIPKMFSGWISSNISVPDWLKTFPVIVVLH